MYILHKASHDRYGDDWVSTLIFAHTDLKTVVTYAKENKHFYADIHQLVSDQKGGFTIKYVEDVFNLIVSVS